ncbi:MAG: hypothetical protein HYZ37_15140 [Candidatus Solibacter usitatus]|nr:hypothetical protein [Candidatus Solibacter usitatus]
MANSIPVQEIPVRAALPITGSWAKWLLPSFSDCLFLAALFWLFAAGGGGWAGLLADGDTGWHIRTGEWILEHGKVPKTDLFSFSKAGEAWYAWEWLSDVIYAVLHNAAGLKGLLILSAVLIACFGTLLFRHMMARGATPFAALAVSLLVYGASSIHYLARPHVFTLLAMTVSMWLIDADRRGPSARIWLLAPIVVLWVNLHGGFLALIACLGLLVVGTAAEQAVKVWLDGAAWDLKPVRRYAALAVVCGTLTLCNPYGWRLHEHVFQFLQSDWIKNNIQEFQSPTFRGESALQFEIVLFAALGTAAWLISTRQMAPALLLLFWAHSALTSVRHVPLFMIVSAPYIASALTALWRAFIEPAGKKTIRGIFASLAKDTEPGCRRSSIWIGVAVLALLVLPETAIRWPKDFPQVKFPVAMAERHREKINAQRLLTMDQWADYLIYRFYPRHRVYVDGRSDFFGKELGEQYLSMSQGRWQWKKYLDENRFNLVLSPLEWPLASLLKTSGDWRLIEDDGQALLFERVLPYQDVELVPSPQAK